MGLINPDHLKPGEIYLQEVKYEMFSDETNRLYIKNNYFVRHTVFWNKLDKLWETSQDEFPLAALPWFIDRIENGFWKTPDQGGLSDHERSVSAEFDGEKVGINAMIHCCAENLFGYNFWNANRASYVIDNPPQQWDIPRYMLRDQGLLDQLKAIAKRYANK